MLSLLKRVRRGLLHQPRQPLARLAVQIHLRNIHSQLRVENMSGSWFTSEQLNEASFWDHKDVLHCNVLQLGYAFLGKFSCNAKLDII